MNWETAPDLMRLSEVAPLVRRIARTIRLFALVTRDALNTMVPRSFRVVTSGTPIERGEQTYVGTVIDEVGQAYHVFEVMG